MKCRFLTGLASVAMSLVVWNSVAAAEPAKKPPKPTARVGTFDSRAIALADFGKTIQDGWLEKLYAEHDKAKAAGDKKRAEKLAAKGQSRQKLFHRQVFGTAPVNAALEKVKEDIPTVARSARVDMVVCIHNVVYRDPSLEFVDITDELVALFNPDEDTREKIQAVLKHPPFPDEVVEKMECHGPEKQD